MSDAKSRLKLVPSSLIGHKALWDLRVPQGSDHGVGSPSLTNVMAPMVLTGLPLWLNWKRIFLQCRRHGFDPWVGKIPGEGKGYLLQYSGLENSMDCIVHGVTKSQTQLSDFHFHFFSVSKGFGGGESCLAFPK